MVTRGYADKHRYSYSGGVKAVEIEKWGRSKAQEIVGGPLKSPDTRPNDSCYPQKLGDPNNLQGRTYYNTEPSDKSWVRGGGEDATTKPNFDPCYKGNKR